MLVILMKPNTPVMKGYVPVEIPVKRYIKAYIESNLGLPIKLGRQSRSLIIEKLHDYLEKKEPTKHSTSREYPVTIKVYITFAQYRNIGDTLSSTNIRNFNIFCETLIKEKYYNLMNDAWEVLPGFECHLPSIRKKLGIDIEAWSDDSMKKDYYRYRKRKGLRLLNRKERSHLKMSALHLPFL
ncbi:MAG: hypothetical protein BGO53_08900 [Sphingobacteriales bacterium 39-19]|nr:MAG: hypothetical protein BGO53_08900 [Sphingobacteriales bacterium 39-19]